MAVKSESARPGRRPNYGLVIVSVALVLFLLGFFGLLLVQGRQLARVLKEGIDIIVELHQDTPPEQRAGVEEALNGSEYVKPGSVRFISKEEGIKLMSDEFGEDVMRLDLPNPLYDVFAFNVQARYMQNDSLSGIRAQLRQLPAVSNVVYQESLLDQIAANMTRFGWLLLGASVLFVIVALTLIHNVIRLSLYANRFIIKTQELVGATWGFISRPYLRRAATHGLLSACLAIAGLLAAQYWLGRQLPGMETLFSPLAFGGLFAGLVLLGVSINWLSTYYVVRKYLRMRVDDLY
jgi:cell division transport system permease protein